MIMEDTINNAHLRRGGDWMTIWKLCIPQKGSYFFGVWLEDVFLVPTRCNLQKQNVLRCVLCEEFDEDELRVFFNGKKAGKVWRYAGLWNVVRVKLLPGIGFSEVLFALLSCGSVPQTKSTTMQFWCIWKRRNERVWEQVDRPVSVSAMIAMDVLYDWEAVRNTRATALVDQQVPGQVEWSKPDGW